nr:hypothetical protein Iba_chr02dCG0010 [Ipomoea batatas]
MVPPPHLGLRRAPPSPRPPPFLPPLSPATVPPPASPSAPGAQTSPSPSDTWRRIFHTQNPRPPDPLGQSLQPPDPLGQSPQPLPHHHPLELPPAQEEAAVHHLPSHSPWVVLVRVNPDLPRVQAGEREERKTAAAQPPPLHPQRPFGNLRFPLPWRKKRRWFPFQMPFDRIFGAERGRQGRRRRAEF